MGWEVLVSTRRGVFQSFVRSPDGHSLADGSYAAADPQPTRIQLLFALSALSVYVTSVSA